VPHYILLLYMPAEGRPSPEESAAEMPKWAAYTQELQDKGVFVAGDALQPTSTATTVRERNGDRLVTDGPFAETKEQLGGYYVIEVDSLDDALDWAARIPSAKLGSIEVRPVMDTSGGGA
jgi:hypothetical protein